MQSDQRSKTGKVFVEAAKLIKYIGFEMIGSSATKGAQEQIKNLEKGDLDGLVELIFGFDVKNKLHNELRAYQQRIADNKKDWADDHIVETWGDIPLAIDMLGRL